MKKLSLISCLLVAFTLGMTGCTRTTPERIGDNTERAAESVGEGMEDVGEATEDGVERVGEAGEELGDEIEKTAE